jgi:hypothetical protein
VGNALAGVELVETCLDLRKKHEAFDRVIHRRVRRHLAERFDNLITVEVKEVIRLWRAGVPKKRLAAKLGLDPKTARRYLRAAEAAGLRREGLAVELCAVHRVAPGNA